MARHTTLSEKQIAELSTVTQLGLSIAQLRGAPGMEQSAMVLLRVFTKHIAETYKEESGEMKAAIEKSTKEAAERMRREGPKLWEMLHSRAAVTVADPEQEKAWLENHFAELLPCGSCARHFKRQLAGLKDFNNYFRWTVDVHNSVNSKTGKPFMTYEQAAAKWRKG